MPNGLDLLRVRGFLAFFFHLVPAEQGGRIIVFQASCVWPSPVAEVPAGSRAGAAPALPLVLREGCRLTAQRSCSGTTGVQCATIGEP